jgi:hypothetical protein
MPSRSLTTLGEMPAWSATAAFGVANVVHADSRKSGSFNVGWTRCAASLRCGTRGGIHPQGTFG